MNTHSPKRTGRLSITLVTLALVLSAGLASLAHAGSVGRVSVTDVEDVRDAATIARSKAQNRAEESGEDGGSSGGFSSSGGCSDLNIGNVSTGVGQRVPRNVTIVIEGPVIQENNCR